jgi:hypothetical protein
MYYPRPEVSLYFQGQCQPHSYHELLHIVPAVLSHRAECRIWTLFAIYWHVRSGTLCPRRG